MESVLGRGYSINDESGLTDFYSPPSSIIDEDEDDDLFYPEEDEEENENENEIEPNNDTNNPILSCSSNVLNKEDDYKPLPLKLMSIESTPPPTPLISRQLIDTTMSFQNMTLKTPSKSADWTYTSHTSKLTPTSIDRYLIEHSMYKSTTIQHTEVTNGLY